MTKKPAGPITGASAWKGEDLARDKSWAYRLSKDAIAEIDEGVKSIKARGIALADIRQKDFPLPSIAEDVKNILDQIENGTGFALVKGLPVEKYSEDEAAIAFWGLGTHFGTAISQNAAGELLGHVRAEGGEVGQTNVRAYTTNSRLRFHSDNADVIALLCVRPAKSGGQSSVVSAITVYNEILASRPDYLDQLFEGSIYDLMGEERAGVGPVTDHRVPIFSYHANRLSCHYSRNSINLAPRKTGVPLSAEETAVLNYFDATAERPDLRFDLYLEPGDLQLLNNHICLHSRTQYVDHDETARRRHLLRLWLTVPEPIELAADFENRYGGTYSFRDGIPRKTQAA